MDQLSAFNSNQDTQQNGGTNAAASDTAAAALHYPIAGDTSFQTQGSSGEYPDAGYGLDHLKDSPTQGQGSQHSPGGGTTPSKPAVGSEEWHKIRKDNHKEGRYCSFQTV
jgi:bHLH factor